MEGEEGERKGRTGLKMSESRWILILIPSWGFVKNNLNILKNKEIKLFLKLRTYLNLKGVVIYLVKYSQEMEYIVDLAVEHRDKTKEMRAIPMIIIRRISS